MTFEHLSSHALTARLGELLATERRTIASFVLHLAELERRQLHLELGYSSTFVFCTQHLKLTNASAFRRTTAARLVTRYPAIAEMLSTAVCASPPSRTSVTCSTTTTTARSSIAPQAGPRTR